MTQVLARPYATSIGAEEKFHSMRITEKYGRKNARIGRVENAYITTNATMASVMNSELSEQVGEDNIALQSDRKGLVAWECESIGNPLRGPPRCCNNLVERTLDTPFSAGGLVVLRGNMNFGVLEKAIFDAPAVSLAVKRRTVTTKSEDAVDKWGIGNALRVETHVPVRESTKVETFLANNLFKLVEEKTMPYVPISWYTVVTTLSSAEHPSRCTYKVGIGPRSESAESLPDE